MLGVAGPPRSFGLYRDGNRIAALPQPRTGRCRLCRRRAGRAAVPAGAACARAAGRRLGRVPHRRGAARWAPPRSPWLEPEAGAARRAAARARPLAAAGAATRACTLLRAPRPLAAVRQGRRYDLIDISGRLPRRRRGQRHRLQRRGDRRLPARPGAGRAGLDPGLDPRLPVYAMRMLATARAALQRAGVADAGRACGGLPLGLERPHPAVARRLGRRAHRRGAQASATTARSTCRWYPGIDVAGRARRHLQRPAGGILREGRGTVGRPGRLHRRRGRRGAGGQPTAPRARRSTCARSRSTGRIFYAVLRLDQLGTLLRRLEILPQAEIGGAGEPGGAGAGGGDRRCWCCWCRWPAPRRLRAGSVGAAARRSVYFPALGLGFLFIEIYLIERASFWLQRPDQRLCPGADRHAGVLRPRQHGGGPLGRAPARGGGRLRCWWRWCGASPCGSGCSR